jgi:hypothetical protein
MVMVNGTLQDEAPMSVNFGEASAHFDQYWPLTQSSAACGSESSGASAYSQMRPWHLSFPNADGNKIINDYRGLLSRNVGIGRNPSSDPLTLGWVGEQARAFLGLYWIVVRAFASAALTQVFACVASGDET